MKRIFVLVEGYIKGEVYHTADRWIREHEDATDAKERHVYSDSSEGYQVHIISNTEINDEELSDLLFNGDEGTDWEQLDEDGYYQRPKGGIARFTGPNHGGEWWTAGSILGYNPDDDERYEA